MATQNQGCIISPYVSETTDDIVKVSQNNNEDTTNKPIWISN